MEMGSDYNEGVIFFFLLRNSPTANAASSIGADNISDERINHAHHRDCVGRAEGETKRTVADSAA